MVHLSEETAERLMRTHKDAVYRQLFRMCGNKEDAEDVLVDSMVKAHLAMSTLQTEESFRAWLAMIAKRTCGRLKKREAMRPVLRLAKLLEDGFEPAASDIDPTEQLAEEQMKTCILAAFHSLPEKYAAVYQARDIDGLTAEATATKLGLSIAAVKSRLHRARAMIRERIDCDLA